MPNDCQPYIYQFLRFKPFFLLACLGFYKRFDHVIKRFLFSTFLTFYNVLNYFSTFLLHRCGSAIACVVKPERVCERSTGEWRGLSRREDGVTCRNFIALSVPVHRYTPGSAAAV